MSDYTRIDEIAFETRYRPLCDEDGAWRDFDWTMESDRAAIAQATDERRIWTTLDVDGFVILSAGWHFVNRLGYVITEVPVADDLEVEVFDPEELEEWQERVQIAEELGPDSP